MSLPNSGVQSRLQLLMFLYWRSYIDQRVSAPVDQYFLKIKSQNSLPSHVLTKACAFAKSCQFLVGFETPEGCAFALAR